MKTYLLTSIAALALASHASAITFTATYDLTGGSGNMTNFQRGATVTQVTSSSPYNAGVYGNYAPWDHGVIFGSFRQADDFVGGTRPLVLTPTSAGINFNLQSPADADGSSLGLGTNGVFSGTDSASFFEFRVTNNGAADIYLIGYTAMFANLTGDSASYRMNFQEDGDNGSLIGVQGITVTPISVTTTNTSGARQIAAGTSRVYQIDLGVSGGSGPASFNLTSFTVQFAGGVPEPTSTMLLGLGAAGLLMRRRRDS